MKKALVFIFVILVIAEARTQIVIQNQTFTSTQTYSGSSWDGLIIKNCVFENIIAPTTTAENAIVLMGASNVTIDSCIFRNIQGNGIKIRELLGGSDGITITNCVFDSIYANGIIVYQDNPNVIIRNNQMNNIGLDTIGASLGQPHHGIYSRSKNILIEGNIIRNIYNNNGNCVSIRSSGTIRNNILYNATKFGISYYSDHLGFNDTLFIENNIIYNNDIQGIGFYSNGDTANHIGKAIVRFNTIVQQTGSCIYTAANVETINIEVYANIGVRLDGNPQIIAFNSTTSEFTNLFSNTDIGFVDVLNNDYHLTNLSTAIGYATGVIDFPADDFEGDSRTISMLDVGADQLSLTSGLIEREKQKSSFEIYPNPATHTIKVELNNDVQIKTIAIYDLTGKLIILKKSVPKSQIIKLNIEGLSAGTYFIKVNNLISSKFIILK